MSHFTYRKMAVALCAAGLCFTGASAFATGSASGTLNVSATLTNACAFSGTVSMGFGSFAGLLATNNQTQATTVGLACTTGTSPSLSIAAPTVLVGTANSGNTIPYALTVGTESPTALSTTPVSIPGYTATGDVVSFTINGLLAASDFGHMPADSYTQAVTLQVNY